MSDMRIQVTVKEKELDQEKTYNYCNSQDKKKWESELGHWQDSLRVGTTICLSFVKNYLA